MSRDKLQIRELQSGDMEQILELWSLLMVHHQGLDLPLYTLKSEATLTYERWLNRRIKDDGAWVLVAEMDQRVVGYILAMVGYRSPVYSQRTVGMICDISVMPNFSRRGVGSELVNQVLLAFLNEDVDCVQVNYDHQNEAASQFWMKMGFRPRLVEAYRQLRVPADTAPVEGINESRFSCEN